MTTEDIKAWLPALLFLWNIALTLVAVLRKPGEAAGVAVAELRAEHSRELQEIKQSLVAVQTEIEHMPNSEELANLRGTVMQIDERTASLSEQIKSVAATTQRIENWLLNHR